MYESYWQLRQKPFENCADPRFYYPGQPHQAALLKLRYAVENQRGGALLSGPSGSGKTLVVGMLRAMLADRFSPFVHLVFPQMPADQLLAYLAGQLTAPADGPATPDIPHSIRQIEQFLGSNTEEGKHAVLVIDEAHLLEGHRTLEALRLLLNFQFDCRPGLTLLLAGQPGLMPILDRVPQLEERLGVKCLLRPFNGQETAEYVAHRLSLAGAPRPIFEPDALSAVHRLTLGIARRINRLCDLALLIGFAEERRTITAAQLEAVSQELVTVVPE
jgi:type II secretory pathway predicted ATPase ExeA